MGIPLVHFSTDYIFDGTKEGPYTIYDQPNPLGVYGRSKLLGEQYILWLLRKFYLVRTTWMFGTYGKNFIDTMLEIAQKQQKISVVNDQRGCPTWTRQLAEAVADLIVTGRYGVYHITSSEPTTWFNFAKEIYNRALSHRLCHLHDRAFIPITTAEYPTDAKRPKYSTLSKTKIKKTLNRDIRTWELALDCCLAELSRERMKKNA